MFRSAKILAGKGSVLGICRGIDILFIEVFEDRIDMSFGIIDVILLLLL